MTSALIGHSGFVGSNLKDKRSFPALYKSKTIGSIAGESYDLAIWKVRAVPTEFSVVRGDIFSS